MKVFLMFSDRDCQGRDALPGHHATLMQDLELATLIKAMSAGDKVLAEVAESALLQSLGQPEAILYRQAVLRDCLAHPAVVRELYAIAVAAAEAERQCYRSLFRRYPSGVLWQSASALPIFADLLKKLRTLAALHVHEFQSAGFQILFAMLVRELDDGYFSLIRKRLKELRFVDGVLVSAQLGRGHKGFNYVLRKPGEPALGWFRRLFAKKNPAFTIEIHPRDEHGAKALGELRDRGINLVANAVAQSLDHIVSFLRVLRTELAFYIGCMNLHDALARKGIPLAFPTPQPAAERGLAFTALYDAGLALSTERRTVGNDLNADGREMILITGANNGGKSTYLRSLGVAQMLMQCGMFVPAQAYRASLASRLFTHYRRKEDVLMKSGKLDEELARMSEIVDQVKPGSTLMFNESFSATNEREGSEIARLITAALLERKIRIIFVTHLFEFAHGLAAQGTEQALCLRAERLVDGTRTFRINEGQPLQTSFGEDLYQEVFSGPGSAARSR